MLDERGNVGTEEVLALAQADHERRVAARTEHDAGQVFVHGDEGERAFEAPRDRTERREHVAEFAVLAAKQQRRDLAVGLALERVSLAGEFVAQLSKVFDDAVVDQRELAVVTKVRVRVLVGGAAMGRPPRVPDAGVAGRQRVRCQVVAQHLELACALAHFEGAVVGNDRDPG